MTKDFELADRGFALTKYMFPSIWKQFEFFMYPTECKGSTNFISLYLLSSEFLSFLFCLLNYVSDITGADYVWSVLITCTIFGNPVQHYDPYSV